MSQYYTLTVKKVVEEISDTISIFFKQPFFKKIRYLPGQFLILILKIEGKEYRRAYSIYTVFDLDIMIGIAIKRLKGGKISHFMNDRVQAGDRIQVTKALGNFVLTPKKNITRSILFFAAGSGITPILPMLRSILFFEPCTTVMLIYANRNGKNILFKGKLENLQSKFEKRISVIHVLSQPSSYWTGWKGRINKDMLLNILLKIPKEKVLCYLCGPEGFMKTIKETINFLGISKDRIFTENFTFNEELNSSSSFVKGQTITLLFKKKKYLLFVPPGKTILEASLNKDIDLPYGCQNGLCRACLGICKSGKIQMIHYDGLTQEEIQEGYVLTCQGHPLSKDIVIEVE